MLSLSTDHRKGCKGGIPKKHDIFLLLNQIKNIVDIDEKFYDYADILSPYGVAMRYPNELQIDENHAARAIELANYFTSWANGYIIGVAI